MYRLWGASDIEDILLSHFLSIMKARRETQMNEYFLTLMSLLMMDCWKPTSTAMTLFIPSVTSEDHTFISFHLLIYHQRVARRRKE